MKIIVDEIVVDDIVVTVAVEDIVEDVEDTVVVVNVWAHMTRCWWLQRPRLGSKCVPAGQRNRWVEPGSCVLTGPRSCRYWLL